jgi:hypothetical protein
MTTHIDHEAETRRDGQNGTILSPEKLIEEIDEIRVARNDLKARVNLAGPIAWAGLALTVVGAIIGLATWLLTK